MKSRLHERIVVVYEDIDVVIIDKAAGVLSYPVEGRREEGAIQLVRRYWKSRGFTNEHLYLLHRLDEGTSGLMMFAKTTIARESLQVQFEEHSVVRCYLAVTAGIPPVQEGTVTGRLGRDNTGRRAVSDHGRESITFYRVLRTNRNRRRALVRCRLQTGRTHQVRIHMQSLHSPVLGDAVYGEARGANRLMLHAEALGFIHPRSGRSCVFRTPPPPEFLRALQ